MMASWAAPLLLKSEEVKQGTPLVRAWRPAGPVFWSFGTGAVYSFIAFESSLSIEKSRPAGRASQSGSIQLVHDAVGIGTAPLAHFCLGTDEIERQQKANDTVQS